MALTVTEREHWKERIARRIDKAIASVVSQADANLLDRVSREAKAQAAKSLGLDDLMKRRTSAVNEIARLQGERDGLHREMEAVVRGLNVNDVGKASYYGSLPCVVDDAIRSRAVAFEETLLAKDEYGRKILELRREKESLLDTVWLATSGKQIRELWEQVREYLAEKPTALESKAITISASEDG